MANLNIERNTHINILSHERDHGIYYSAHM